MQLIIFYTLLLQQLVSVATASHSQKPSPTSLFYKNLLQKIIQQRDKLIEETAIKTSQSTRPYDRKVYKNDVLPISFSKIDNSQLATTNKLTNNQQFVSKLVQPVIKNPENKGFQSQLLKKFNIKQLMQDRLKRIGSNTFDYRPREVTRSRSYAPRLTDSQVSSFGNGNRLDFLNQPLFKNAFNRQPEYHPRTVEFNSFKMDKFPSVVAQETLREANQIPNLLTDIKKTGKDLQPILPSELIDTTTTRKTASNSRPYLPISNFGFKRPIRIRTVPCSPASFDCSKYVDTLGNDPMQAGKRDLYPEEDLEQFNDPYQQIRASIRSVQNLLKNP